jgi:predicted RNA methylase
VDGRENAESVEALAAVIASPLTRRLLETFTEGSLRYRLSFVGKGHQRGAVREVAARAFALCPEILNDARNAPWAIEVYPGERKSLVELRPRITPDPRLAYRRQDVPAASHPPLAACMARLGMGTDDVIWDPFCGSGLELIERARLGGVRKIFGTDLDPRAVAITQENIVAANLPLIDTELVCADFRDFVRSGDLRANTVSLIITNPPMGKRVPIPDLRQLIEDLFTTAATVLKPGGRLIFANPLRLESPTRALKLESRRVVDFGGFDCRLESYRKVGG